MLTQLRGAPERTREVDLRIAATLIEVGEPETAVSMLDAIAAGDPRDWRASWYLGIAELARGLAQEACSSFTAVYHAVPGELAPKLALALALKSAGDSREAAAWYEIVSRTDPRPRAHRLDWPAAGCSRATTPARWLRTRAFRSPRTGTRCANGADPMPRVS